MCHLPFKLFVIPISAINFVLVIPIIEKATLRKLDDDDSESASQYKPHNEEDSISTASVPPIEQMGLFEGIFS